MRLSQQLREQYGQLTDEAEALSQVIAADKLPEDSEQFERMSAIITADTGELARLAKRIADQERLEQIRDGLTNQRTGTPPAPQRANEPAPKTETVTPREAAQMFACPATVKLHGALRAFRDPDRQRAKAQAYAFGQWFLATHGHGGGIEYCKANGIPLIRAALTEGDNTAGGYTVPDQFEATIIDLRNEYGVMRREAQIVPMTSDTRNQPKRTGGPTAYFVGENAEITASDKTWENVSLTAKKLAVLVKYSSELNEDTVVSMADDLASEIAYAFAVKEDQCGFIGDGTSTYGGMVGLKNALQAGSEYTAVTGNTSFKELDLADFVSMIAKVQGYALTRGNAKWFIHRSAWADSMLRLAEAAGGNTVVQIQGGVTPQFLGYPVVFVEAGNNTLTAQTSAEGLLYFGDLRLTTMLGSRRGIAIMTSDQRYFEYDQLAIKGTERYDVNVHDRGTASVSGGIVQLLAPGS